MLNNVRGPLPFNHATHKLDDPLGHLISRRRLAPDDTDPRDDLLAVRRAHLLDQVIAVDDTEHIEQLPLILVDALDLDVEHSVSRDLDA